MAKMKKIPVESLKPGMIFDKSLYIDQNTMLVEANNEVTADDIKKLMKWGVSDIETAGTLMGHGKKSKDNKEGATETTTPSPEKTNPKNSYSDEQTIVKNYNDLLKKRKTVIELYSQAMKEVETAYELIRKDKEFSKKGLIESVDNIMNLLQENSNVFLFLYGLGEGKDPLVTHSVNVTFYSIIIGIAMNFSQEKLRNLGLGTMLIDAGMIKVPVYIIHKQSNLTDQEFKQIKTHPIHGYKAIRQLGTIKESVANISLQHHEQFDGKGYPRGLKGNEIDEFARIAAIADSYEAQISIRSYRQKIYFYHAMRNLLSSGVNKFDSVILKVFLSRMSVYPIGSLIEINDTSKGIVIGSIPEKPLRPIVKLVVDSSGNKIEDTVILNLLEKTSFYITKALDEEESGINIFDVL